MASSGGGQDRHPAADVVLSAVAPPALALWVDPKVHAAEVARFRSKIVAGPGDGDCSIWISR